MPFSLLLGQETAGETQEAAIVLLPLGIEDFSGREREMRAFKNAFVGASTRALQQHFKEARSGRDVEKNMKQIYDDLTADSAEGMYRGFLSFRVERHLRHLPFRRARFDPRQ